MLSHLFRLQTAAQSIGSNQSRVSRTTVRNLWSPVSRSSIASSTSAALVSGPSAKVVSSRLPAPSSVWMKIGSGNSAARLVLPMPGTP